MQFCYQNFFNSILPSTQQCFSLSLPDKFDISTDFYNKKNFPPSAVCARCVITVSVIRRMYHHFRIQYVKVATVNCNWIPELILFLLFLSLLRCRFDRCTKTNGLHIHNSRPESNKEVNMWICEFAFVCSDVLNKLQSFSLCSLKLY